MDILCREPGLAFRLRLHDGRPLLLRPVQRQTVNTFVSQRLASPGRFLKASIDHTINNIGESAGSLKERSLIWRFFH
jgi:hypothetical protein